MLLLLLLFVWALVLIQSLVKNPLFNLPNLNCHTIRNNEFDPVLDLDAKLFDRMLIVLDAIDLHIPWLNERFESLRHDVEVSGVEPTLDRLLRIWHVVLFLLPDAIDVLFNRHHHIPTFCRVDVAHVLGTMLAFKPFFDSVRLSDILKVVNDNLNDGRYLRLIEIFGAIDVVLDLTISHKDSYGLNQNIEVENICFESFSLVFLY